MQTKLWGLFLVCICWLTLETKFQNCLLLFEKLLKAKSYNWCPIKQSCWLMSSLIETESLSNTKVGTLRQLSDIIETWYKWLKSTCPTVLYISFEFHSKLYIIRRSKNWISITIYFRNGKIPWANLECWWVTFCHNCN